MAEVLNLGEGKRKKRFSDFAHEPIALDGVKTTIEAVLGEEIQVLAYRNSKSKFDDSKTGIYTMIQFRRKSGVKTVLFTSSSILTRQCEQYSNQMPFWTSIQKVHRYFTMT